MIKLEDIQATDKQSFIKCKYVAKDGSVIEEKYYHTSMSEAKRNFKNYINNNKLY